MLWSLLAVVVVLASIGLVAVLVLRLWRQVKEFTAVVSAAGDRLTSATDALEAAQSTDPRSAPAPAHGPPSRS